MDHALADVYEKTADTIERDVREPENLEIGKPEREHEIERTKQPAREPLTQPAPAELPDPAQAPVEAPVEVPAK